MVVRKKGRRKSTVSENSDYVFQIQDWSPSYSMRLDPKERFSPGPYWEHLKIEITGLVLSPESLKNRVVRMVFLASRNYVSFIEGSESHENTPKGIGYLNFRGSTSEVICSLPIDFFQMLPFLLHIGKFKFILMFGPKLYRGESSIISFRFEQEYNPEEE
jgi:hypothetical protein